MFLLFAGEIYYPCGGWDDFQGAYPTLQEAITAAGKLRFRWQHIVDMKQSAIVWQDATEIVWSRG